MTDVRRRNVAVNDPTDDAWDGHKVDVSSTDCFTKDVKATGDNTNDVVQMATKAMLSTDAADDDDDKAEDDVDERVMPDLAAAESLNKAVDRTSEVIDATLKDVSPRWRNWIVRTIFTAMMISGFLLVVWLGPLALMLLILLIQIKCFHEIITIGHVVYRSHELPWFRTLSWYFLIAANYFFYGESMVQYFGVFMSRTEFLNPLVIYHRFISFSLYVAGLCGFVFSLRKKNYLKQFTMFGWTHVTLLILVTQSHLIMQNVFEGVIWFLVPVSMIICNDIMAYIFGFFFGRTPLIKLSPKKTWEGFIGGAFSTILFGVISSYMLVQLDFLVCPISYDETKEALSMECERPAEFVLHAYALPSIVQNIGAVVGQNWKSITVYPFVFHSISLSLFASVIGPFGGFFASGFKRAFKIKDFADTIPGHGGFMDRFDCQLLMATFVHVYHSSFIKAVSPQKLVQQILSLKPEQQLQIFTMLQDVLTKRGVLS